MEPWAVCLFLFSGWVWKYNFCYWQQKYTFYFNSSLCLLCCRLDQLLASQAWNLLPLKLHLQCIPNTVQYFKVCWKCTHLTYPLPCWNLKYSVFCSFPCGCVFPNRLCSWVIKQLFWLPWEVWKDKTEYLPKSVHLSNFRREVKAVESQSWLGT